MVSTRPSFGRPFGFEVSENYTRNNMNKEVVDVRIKISGIDVTMMRRKDIQSKSSIDWVANTYPAV